MTTRYEAGIWDQTDGFVPWSTHGTRELAVRAARRYARARTAPTGGALSWSGGVRGPDGRVSWYRATAAIDAATADPKSCDETGAGRAETRS